MAICRSGKYFVKAKELLAGFFVSLSVEILHHAKVYRFYRIICPGFIS
jgi:hypothetical protein